MRDPLRRLKTLPWLVLLQIAALTVLIATGLDILLLQLLLLLPRNGWGPLMPFLSLLLIVLPFVVGLGLGALAFLLMQRFFRQIYPDTATLWALVPCIALLVFLKGLLPIPTFLVSLSYPQVIGIIVGVFLTGKRYSRF